MRDLRARRQYSSGTENPRFASVSFHTSAVPSRLLLIFRLQRTRYICHGVLPSKGAGTARFQRGFIRRPSPVVPHHSLFQR